MLKLQLDRILKVVVGLARRARPNMFVDWMQLSKKKMTVLSNPRLMVNDLKTEQKN